MKNWKKRLLMIPLFLLIIIMLCAAFFFYKKYVRGPYRIDYFPDSSFVCWGLLRDFKDFEVYAVEMKLLKPDPKKPGNFVKTDFAAKYGRTSIRIGFGNSFNVFQINKDQIYKAAASMKVPVKEIKKNDDIFYYMNIPLEDKKTYSCLFTFKKGKLFSIAFSIDRTPFPDSIDSPFALNIGNNKEYAFPIKRDALYEILPESLSKKSMVLEIF